MISEGTNPTPTAETNVPRNAKVRMEPKLRKKFSCRGSGQEDHTCSQNDTHLFELVARIEDDRRKKQVEEECMLEGLAVWWSIHKMQ